MVSVWVLVSRPASSPFVMSWVSVLGLRPPGLGLGVGLGPSGSRTSGQDFPRPGENAKSRALFLLYFILFVISYKSYLVDLPLNVFILRFSCFVGWLISFISINQTYYHKYILILNWPSARDNNPMNDTI